MVSGRPPSILQFSEDNVVFPVLTFISTELTSLKCAFTDDRIFDVDFLSFLLTEVWLASVCPWATARSSLCFTHGRELTARCLTVTGKEMQISAKQWILVEGSKLLTRGSHVPFVGHRPTCSHAPVEDDACIFFFLYYFFYLNQIYSTYHRAVRLTANSSAAHSPPLFFTQCLKSAGLCLQTAEQDQHVFSATSCSVNYREPGLLPWQQDLIT